MNQDNLYSICRNLLTVSVIAIVFMAATSNAGAIGTLRTASLTNWSGYAVTGQTFNTVTGDFYVNKIACTAPNAMALTWVGLDGFDRKEVEQAGIWAWCSGGKSNYAAFWEMYPTTKAQVLPINIRVGDKVSVTVSYSAGTRLFTMSVRDVKSGQRAAKQMSCGAGVSCGRSSAEWIVERPNANGKPVPLADWGDVGFYNSMASTDGKFQPISAFSHTRILLGNLKNRYNLATISRLNRTGNSFRDTWRYAK